MKKLLFYFVPLVIFLTSGIAAQDREANEVPRTVAFNGKLTDTEGKAFPDDSYDFTFFIYSEANTGQPIWSEVHKNVTVRNGEFNVVLGAGSTPNPLSFKVGSSYSIAIKVNDGEEMVDRFSIVSSPYSLGAKFAESVSDNSITTEKLADNSITDEKIKNVSINKITNLPSSIGNLANLKKHPQIMGSDYEWWTLKGNIIYGPERHFIGVRNARDFVIRSWEIQRMLFDPNGYVVIGTLPHPVHFEVIGKSTFTDDAYIKGVLGVGVYPTSAKMHINVDNSLSPLKVDYQDNNLFQIDANGRTTIRSSVAGSDWDTGNYPLFIDAQSQGIGIKVDGNDWLLNGKASGDNNYMSFWTEDNLLAPVFGNMAGRIEGQTALEYAIDIPNVIHGVYIAALVVAEVIAIANITEEPADVITIGADLAENIIVAGLDLLELGVTYESGSGDYAEWLERSDKSEKMYSGDIVGVKGGKISKNTEDAESYMVISGSPIILGNSPKDGRTEDYEKVAFMGQILVKVRGVVNEGDFIIPSGLNDGTGFAIAPELVTIDEYPRIVGQAWSSSCFDGINLINIHVGLDNKDIGYIVKRIDQQDRYILSEINKLGNVLDDIKDESKAVKMRILNSSNRIDDILAQLKSKQKYTASFAEESND